MNNLLIGGFWFIIGTIVGSFLNVVVIRHNTGLSLFGRSFCPACGRALSWFELIPVASFLAIRGRCHNCHSKISWQYPAVEILTGVLFAAVFLSGFSPITGSTLIVIIILALIIGIYDFRHKIIPDVYVYILIIMSFPAGFILSGEPGDELARFLVSRLLSAFIVALPFILFFFVSKGRWMGFGDAKLAFAIGALLGLASGFTAVFLAFWIGAAVSIALISLQPVISALNLPSNSITIKSEVPFAPFLVIGLFLVIFFQINIFHFSLF